MASVDEMVNQVCRDLPEGYVVSLSMERGAAWVELYEREGRSVGLPDPADKTLSEQLQEALRCALREDRAPKRGRG
jgi:hypothetical protein